LDIKNIEKLLGYFPEKVFFSLYADVGFFRYECAMMEDDRMFCHNTIHANTIDEMIEKIIKAIPDVWQKYLIRVGIREENSSKEMETIEKIKNNHSIALDFIKDYKGQSSKEMKDNG